MLARLVFSVLEGASLGKTQLPRDVAVQSAMHCGTCSQTPTVLTCYGKSDFY